MASFSVEMLLKLVDQVTSPMKGVVDQVKGLENATKAATGAAATAGASAGWVQQQEAIHRAREAAERHYTTVERLMNQQVQFNQIAENWARVSQIGADIGAPIEAMANRALAFEKATEALARAGDMLGDKSSLGKSALALATQTNTPWQKIMQARAEFFKEGGTDIYNEVKPYEAQLLQLARATGAQATDVYKLLFTYMRVAKLPIEEAVASLKVNYSQGLAGSYEFNEMAAQLQGHIAQATTSLGMSGAQATTDLPALLQILRATGGKRADTFLTNFMKAMTDPATTKRMKDELGIDVGAEMQAARERGENPLFRVANLIADKLQAIDPSQRGKIDANGDEVKGAGETLGATFRDFYVRAFMDSFLSQREQLSKFQPSKADAAAKVDEHYQSSISTGAAAEDRRAIAAERAAIIAANSQLDDKRRNADLKAGALNAGADFAQNNPGKTSAAITAWDAIAKTLQYGGAALMSYYTARGGWASLQAHAPGAAATIGNAGGAVGRGIGGIARTVGNAGIAGAGHVVAFGQGVSQTVADTPGAAQALRNIGGVVKNGVVTGAAVYGAQYAIDKAFDALPKPAYPEGYDPAAKLNEGLFDRLNNVWRSVTGAGAAEERTRARDGLAGGAAPAGGASPLDAARQDAAQAGQDIKASLDVTATPRIDQSDMDATLTKARAINAELAKTGQLASSALAATNRAATRSTGALHDGFETR
jgi:hypothetical protein